MRQEEENICCDGDYYECKWRTKVTVLAQCTTSPSVVRHNSFAYWTIIVEPMATAKFTIIIMTFVRLNHVLFLALPCNKFS